MPLIFLLLLLITQFGEFNGIEYETTCTSNACFTLHMEKVSFDKASQSCFHNGGYLMTVRDKEEDDNLHSLLSLIQKDQRLKFWIGLKLHKGDCVLADKPLRGFKWLSGEGDSHFSNWDKEPVDTCTERCVQVSYNPTGENQLKWTAGACKTPTFYVCKFYFQGMCDALLLLGSGHISYTAPFSEAPLQTKIKSLPLGTYAKVTCGDQESHFSVCMLSNDKYQWTVQGPFCKTDHGKCAYNNGGCQHLCQQDSDQVRCLCNQGYTIEEDGLSCKLQDKCTVDACEYECIVGESGLFCKCPTGFKLEANQRNCSDIDECQRSNACRGHLCINTQGSYMCACQDGFQMFQGNCLDLDECVHSKCEHSCLNTIGSFSCYCKDGFTLSEDGYSCMDINECTTQRCQFKCVNTKGSFRCICPEGFNVDATGMDCLSDMTDAPLNDFVGQATQVNITETVPTMTKEPQKGSTPTDVPLPRMVTVMPNNASQASSAKAVSSRVLICVLGSVIPLLLLVTVTLTIAIVRCNRARKEAKKTTTDSYCWVSSGLDPRLEKLYESILTDDL
ncbi:complement component C1q receptor-like [Dunckerocampus dactyliophorus]|uniref:complement component C1q receptor-like n=1 Tax=Dunckerocampus dactyliophorus TaxID=161453 RepID=UPI0024073843|nr:complement component C1q receptor-like [Dunckerocampus dactyliophorus]